jgi:hypothetical protein
MKTSLIVKCGEPMVVVKGRLSVADIKEKVAAFEMLFGVDADLQISGLFRDKRHDLVFARSRTFEVLEVKTKWITCRIDDAEVDVQPADIDVGDPTIRLEMRVAE